MKTTVRVEKLHGLIFDGAMFLGGFAWLGVVPSIGDEVADKTGGAFVLVAILTQMAGAGLKRGFLGSRLALRKDASPKGFAKVVLNGLLGLHFLLFSVMTFFALALLEVYQVESAESTLQEGLWVMLAFIVGGLTTYLVWRAGQPNASQTRLPGWLEFGADGLLWVSVSLVTRIFWDGLVMMIQPSRGIGLSGIGLVLIAAMTILYGFFYLPCRYLFLVEDYQSRLTWVQTLAALSPVVWLVVVGT